MATSNNGSLCSRAANGFHSEYATSVKSSSAAKNHLSRCRSRDNAYTAAASTMLPTPAVSGGMALGFSPFQIRFSIVGKIDAVSRTHASGRSTMENRIWKGENPNAIQDPVFHRGEDRRSEPHARLRQVHTLR